MEDAEGRTPSRKILVEKPVETRVRERRMVGGMLHGESWRGESGEWEDETRRGGGRQGEAYNVQQDHGC